MGGLWLNAIYGHDQASAGNALQLDITTGWDLTDALYVGLNASTQSLKPDVSGVKTSSFSGAALYLQYALSDNFKLGFRGEQFGVKNNHLPTSSTMIPLDVNGNGSVTDLTLSGNLTVNGTTTNINSTNLVVEDKNIVLGDTAEPADAGADGGGITLKGTPDKTFNWVDATDSWTSSEHLDLASGKVLKINGTQVLSATEYTGNAATVTNGITTASKISELAATSSSELAGVISDETGTGALVFANTPTLVTPVLGAATATSIAFADALVGSALATASTSATTTCSVRATSSPLTRPARHGCASRSA